MKVKEEKVAISDDTGESTDVGKIPVEPLPIESPLRRLARKIWGRMHWVFPNALHSPGMDETRYLQKQERESNEASRVPEGEELRLSLVWGMELFGPAEVEQLYEKLARLRWSAGFARSKAGGALDWVRHQRAYGGDGGWYNVGAVAEHGNGQRFMMLSNYASLPVEVDYLLVRIFQSTPSLTCVLVGFVLKERGANNYQIELSRDRRTVRERSKHRWFISILDPAHLKKRSIEQARSKIQDMVGRWFGTNLPGFFCGLSSGRVPTAELITTRTSRLFSDERDEPRSTLSGWRRLLANDSPFDVWTSAECPGLQFSTGEHGSTDEPFHLVVSLCESDVPEDTLKHLGGREHGSYAAYCHEMLDGILSNYAGLAFLREVSKDLKVSRGELKLSRLSHRGGVHVLERIQSFFDRSLGTPAVATELRDRSKHLSLYQHECSNFVSSMWGENDGRREIANVLRERTHFLATRVVAEEHSTREHFEQLSSILSVRESVRAQHRMELLTIVALVAAICSLLVALPPMKDWPSHIQSHLESIRPDR